MADITMCLDSTCPKRKKCYRFTAKPNEYRQSYFSDSPREDGAVGCKEYVSNERTKSV